VRPRTYAIAINRTLKKITPPVKELGQPIEDPGLLWLAIGWLEKHLWKHHDFG
jgi:hypothetical protein